MTEKQKSGRKSKGERTFVGFRVSVDTAAMVEKVREAEGYRYTSDWLASVVSEKLARSDVREIIDAAAADADRGPADQRSASEPK
ncbi:UNVERIFIED_ORG: hypothetical protein ABIB13_002202 [Arthrobacter sp. UYEF2]